MKIVIEDKKVGVEYRFNEYKVFDVLHEIQVDVYYRGKCVDVHRVRDGDGEVVLFPVDLEGGFDEVYDVFKSICRSWFEGKRDVVRLNLMALV